MRKKKPTLVEALFTPTRRGILSIILSDTEKQFTLTELAKKLSVQPSTLQRELVTLTTSQVLLRTKPGKNAFYRANPRLDGAPALKILLGVAKPEAPPPPPLPPRRQRPTRAEAAEKYVRDAVASRLSSWHTSLPRPAQETVTRGLLKNLEDLLVERVRWNGACTRCRELKATMCERCHTFLILSGEKLLQGLPGRAQGPKGPGEK